MHGTATTTTVTKQQEAEAGNGKKKNCQTVRTIYGSRATSPRKIARKTLQPNVGKFNVTTMCKGYSERGGKEGKLGATCVCRLLHELLLLLHTCVHNALVFSSPARATPFPLPHVPCSPLCPFNKSCCAFVALHFCFSCC